MAGGPIERSTTAMPESRLTTSAKALIIEPSVKYSIDIINAEIRARNANRGLWKFSGIPDAFCIGIFSFRYNAAGDDNDNLNDEYVEFRNSCTYPVQMEGWIMNDSNENTYVFPEFLTMNKTKFTLHTGQGENNDADLYWDKTRAVWNNDGDTLLMWKPDGKLVLNYSYG